MTEREQPRLARRLSETFGHSFKSITLKLAGVPEKTRHSLMMSNAKVHSGPGW